MYTVPSEIFDFRVIRWNRLDIQPAHHHETKWVCMGVGGGWVGGGGIGGAGKGQGEKRMLLQKTTEIQPRGLSVPNPVLHHSATLAPGSVHNRNFKTGTGMSKASADTTKIRSCSLSATNPVLYCSATSLPGSARC